MKKVINYWPYFIALIPQFIFNDYIWIVISIIFIGFISQYSIKNNLVFIKMMIIELIVFSMILFIFSDRIFYLKGILENLEIPEILLSICIPIFNSLNVAILFFTGYKLGSLFVNKTKELTSSEI
ncbi:hypothetical protein ACWGOQ_0021015 [Aquimarina sp. M1]